MSIIDKENVIGILDSKESIKKFLNGFRSKSLEEHFSKLSKNFFTNACDGFTFTTTNELNFIHVKKYFGPWGQYLKFQYSFFPDFYNYILDYDYNNGIPAFIVLDNEEFTKLQADFLKSDAYHGELSNSIEIDNAFIHYYAYEDIKFKLDEDLKYITLTDGWMPKVIVPYDCDLFWWLYKKLFKGEN